MKIFPSEFHLLADESTGEIEHTVRGDLIAIGVAIAIRASWDASVAVIVDQIIKTKNSIDEHKEE